MEQMFRRRLSCLTPPPRTNSFFPFNNLFPSQSSNLPYSTQNDRSVFPVIKVEIVNSFTWSEPISSFYCGRTKRRLNVTSLHSATPFRNERRLNVTSFYSATTFCNERRLNVTSLHSAATFRNERRLNVTSLHSATTIHKRFLTVFDCKVTVFRPRWTKLLFKMIITELRQCGGNILTLK